MRRRRALMHTRHTVPLRVRFVNPSMGVSNPVRIPRAKRRAASGELVLKEIRKLQSTVGLSIPRLTFSRLVRGFTDSWIYGFMNRFMD